MPDFSFERSLLLCVFINSMMFGSAWFLAIRRLASTRSQALLDAALLWYAVQYDVVGSAGLAGVLDFKSISAISGVISLTFVAVGWKGRCLPLSTPPRRDRLIVLGVAVFAIGFTLAFAHSQAVVPVISNDAITYHFPAAAQWLQQRRIGYFQTWFFNPANTYSPLAGSIFIAWLMLPFGNDLLARFVEVPALLCVGLAMYRLCRLLACRMPIAAIVAAAAMLCRPIFTPCMMGKDDLFVAFFFLAALIALAPDQTNQRVTAFRFGISLGLLLGTKYTVLLALPVLLLAIDGPCWKKRWWLFCGAIATILAGPWYLHNWITTGNPVFPLSVAHLFPGLFSTSVSRAIAFWPGTFSIMTGDQYGIPIVLLGVLGLLWFGAIFIFFKSPQDQGSEVFRAAGSMAERSTAPRSILRACAIGPLIAVLIFHWRSPFPEVRFLLPVFLLLFASAAVAIDRFCRNEWTAIASASLIAGISLFTLFSARALTIQFVGIAAIASATAVVASLWAGQKTFRKYTAVAAVSFAVCIFIYINWRAYFRDYLASLHTRGSGYDAIYPELNQLWAWVDDHIPANATLDCTNTYMIYPLQGPSLRRQVVYAPTRANIKTIADLPWLGDHLPGEAIVPAAVRETVALPSRDVWMKNLKQMKCEYLLIATAGHGGVSLNPPEHAMLEADPVHFSKLFSCDAGSVYQINLP